MVEGLRNYARGNLGIPIRIDAELVRLFRNRAVQRGKINVQRANVY